VSSVSGGAERRAACTGADFPTRTWASSLGISITLLQLPGLSTTLSHRSISLAEAGAGSARLLRDDAGGICHGRRCRAQAKQQHTQPGERANAAEVVRYAGTRRQAAAAQSMAEFETAVETVGKAVGAMERAAAEAEAAVQAVQAEEEAHQTEAEVGVKQWPPMDQGDVVVRPVCQPDHPTYLAVSPGHNSSDATASRAQEIRRITRGRQQELHDWYAARAAAGLTRKSNQQAAAEQKTKDCSPLTKLGPSSAPNEPSHQPPRGGAAADVSSHTRPTPARPR
jgi:hypothetical protein